MTGESEFSTADHLLALREDRHERQKIWDGANDAKLGGIVENLKAPDCHLILRIKHTGSWLTVQGTTVTGRLLAATDFWDFLCARYDVTPPNLKKM